MKKHNWEEVWGFKLCFGIGTKVVEFECTDCKYHKTETTHRNGFVVLRLEPEATPTNCDDLIAKRVCKRMK